MQRPMPISPQLPALNPLKDAGKVEAIDYTTDFENLLVWILLKNLSILEYQKMT